VSVAPEAVRHTSTSSSSNDSMIGRESNTNLRKKIRDLLTLTPGVSIVQGPDGTRSTSTAARNLQQHPVWMEAITTTVFRRTNGRKAPRSYTLDAVKEFQVVASGANAEFGPDCAAS